MPIVLATAFLAIFFLSMPTIPSQADGAGWALQFDGTTDQVVFTYTRSILGSGWEYTKTVSLWIKPLGSDVCLYHDVGWCDGIFGDRPRWWGIAIGDISGGSDPSQDRIWIFNFDGSPDSYQDIIGVEYTLGEWVNITMVHGDGMLRVYKDGIEVDSLPSGATQQPDTGALPWLQLGGIIASGAKNWTFEGQIDEVRLWDRALSQAEINQYLYQPLNGDEIGLRAYYPMSDGPGSATLSDDSQYDWTGVLLDGGLGVPGNGQLPQWVTSDLPLGPPSTPTATSDSTATETATPTASETPTSTATETPTSTATPTPTETYEPTSTTSSSPTPTDTVTPTSTADSSHEDPSLRVHLPLLIESKYSSKSLQQKDPWQSAWDWLLEILK